MDKKKFGLFIKESRIKKGYTQKELADLLYLDVTAVSKWERGVSYPDITLIPDLCKYLEVSEKELIESSQDSEYRRTKLEANKYKKIVNTYFWVPTIIYIIALVTCFIVNLAVSHTLSWFFIVLASILVSFTFIPTVTKLFNKYKLSIFIGSTFISLFILFLTCSLMNGKNWFMIATMGTLLGYVVFFYPFIFNKQKEYMSEDKYNNLKRYFILTYFGLMMFITILLLISIFIYKRFDLLFGIIITIMIYGIFLVIGGIKLLKINKFLKAAITLAISGIIGLTLFNYIDLIVYGEFQYYAINFLDWESCINGNIYFIIFILYVISLIITLLLGLLKHFKNKKGVK